MEATAAMPNSDAMKRYHVSQRRVLACASAWVIAVLGEIGGIGTRG